MPKTRTHRPDKEQRLRGYCITVIHDLDEALESIEAVQKHLKALRATMVRLLEREKNY